MVPVTVHWPEAANATARPDVAVALTVKSGSPNVLFGSEPNEIVWLAFVAVVVSVTCGAAL